jgi:hypothetical protein
MSYTNEKGREDCAPPAPRTVHPSKGEPVVKQSTPQNADEQAPKRQPVRLLAALDAARREFPAPHRSGNDQHKKRYYATLDDMMAAIEEPLARHGLAYLQRVQTTPLGSIVRTDLVHLESGEAATCAIPLLFEGFSGMNSMQAMGAAITYARRYGLESLLGVPREDDDAHTAGPPRGHQQGGQRPQGQPQRQQAPQGRPQAARPTQQAPRQQADAPVADRPDSGDARPPQPFGVWVRAAAMQLGLPGEELELVNLLHDRAVEQSLMPAVEPDIRAQALARRYYDQQKGRMWRDWMRAECKVLAAGVAASAQQGDAHEPDPDADPEDAPWDPPADEPAPAPAKPAGPRAEMSRREWDAWVKATAGSMAITEWQLVRALHRSGVQAGRWPEKPDTNPDVMRVVSVAWLGSGRAWVEHEAETYRAELARRAAEAPAPAGKVGGR